MTDHHVPFSDLLKRWSVQPETPALWLNTEDSGVFSAMGLTPSEHQHCHFHYAAHQQHVALGIPTLAFATRPTQPLSTVIWQWPKAKAEADMILAWLQSEMAATSDLWLAGHNRGGIRSAQAFLSDRGWSSQIIGKAKHCALLRAQPPQARQRFDLNDYWQVTPIGDQQQWSLPGTFSHGRIDQGSALLLPYLQRLKGPVLDFGCGSGLLSLVAQASQPTLKITAIDHHWLSILSTQETARRNGLTWQIIWHDGLPTGRWQTIISNPPFHNGLNVQYEITQRLLQQAELALPRGGTLWLVVNDHLPYGDWLKAHTDFAKEMQHARGYRVWQAQLNGRG